MERRLALWRRYPIQYKQNKVHRNLHFAKAHNQVNVKIIFWTMSFRIMSLLLIYWCHASKKGTLSFANYISLKMKQKNICFNWTWWCKNYFSNSKLKTRYKRLGINEVGMELKLKYFFLTHNTALSGLAPSYLKDIIVSLYPTWAFAFRWSKLSFSYSVIGSSGWGICYFRLVFSFPMYLYVTAAFTYLLSSEIYGFISVCSSLSLGWMEVLFC